MQEPPENNVKQVIVVRTDLNMRKGKIAAQAAHASLGVITNRIHIADNGKVTGFLPEGIVQWLHGPFTKIVLGCKDEEELVNIYKQAVNLGIPSCLITDSGRTEFHGVPTKTCCAIGPAKISEIDKVTSHLTLL